MTGILSFLIIVASVLLILVVYVQNPKGGGLSADFGGASQLGGVQRTNELIDKLNELHPKMVERGGGVQDIEIRTFERTERNPLMLIVHILVDTCDAMGANIACRMDMGAPVAGIINILLPGAAE